MTDRRRELLARVGRLAQGEAWQRAMAVELGRFHPAGPRDRIDERLVRRWVAGHRPIPDWVGPALQQICREIAARGAEPMPGEAVALLQHVGRLVHGGEWQRALSIDLGRYHPDGVRPRFDERQVRRWVAGDQRIPDWAGAALRQIAADWGIGQQASSLLAELEVW
ncbi:MAG: hypothetical protein J0H82_06395 [Alphaproteobacteria bacterium]|jgi:hypothetical protein|nr:hypothetical protein [Alphaproteobacteria bacterium]